MTLNSILAAVSALLVGFCSAASGQDPWGDDSQVRDLRSALIAGRDPIGAGRACSKLEKQWSDGLRHKLISDDDASIAVLASWLQAVHDAKKKNLKPQRLLGFIEGRIEAEIPVFWEARLLSRLLRDDRKMLREVLSDYAGLKGSLISREPGGNYLVRQPDSAAIGMGLESTDGLKLEKKDGSIRVQIGDRVIVSKDELVTTILKANPPAGFVLASAATNGSYTVVASRDPYGSKYPICCLENSTGKAVWKADVWGLGPGSITHTGPAWHNVTIAFGKNRVAVFGESSDCYVEVFDIRTGRSLCRFATNYWLIGR